MIALVKTRFDTCKEELYERYDCDDSLEIAWVCLLQLLVRAFGLAADQTRQGKGTGGMRGSLPGSASVAALFCPAPELPSRRQIFEYTSSIGSTRA